VRGEVSGTPSGERFGVPHTGRSFPHMAIDIQTIRTEDRADLHLENWLSAMGSCEQQESAVEAAGIRSSFATTRSLGDGAAHEHGALALAQAVGLENGSTACS